MSIFNFSKNQFARIFGENEIVKIATHSADGGELAHIRMRVFSNGNNVGAKIKLFVFPFGNSNAKVAESNEILVTDIGQDFFGMVRFDFNRENISSGNYDIYAEIKNYTRNGDVDYFALIHDFPSQVYNTSPTSFVETAIALEDFYYI